MNILKSLKKEICGSYKLMYRYLDKTGAAITETKVLEIEDYKEIDNVTNNVSSLYIRIDLNDATIFETRDIVADYFILDSLRNMIQTTKDFRMSRKHRKAILKVM